MPVVPDAEIIPGALNIEVPENAAPPGLLSPPSVNPAWAAPPQWQQAPVDAAAAAAQGDVGGASEARDPSEAGRAGSGDNEVGSPASVASAAGGVPAGEPSLHSTSFPVKERDDVILSEQCVKTDEKGVSRRGGGKVVYCQ